MVKKPIQVPEEDFEEEFDEEPEVVEDLVEMEDEPQMVNIPMRVAEAYVSIQGEGLLIGAQTLFIRLHGCNQKCSWCDTKDIKVDTRWNMNTIKALLQKHVAAGYDVVVTGGEPMIQPQAVAFIIASVINFRDDYGTNSNITIETNGTISPNELYLPEDILSQVFWSVSPKLRSSGQFWRKVQFKDFLKMSQKQLKFPIDPYSKEDLADFETIMLFISPDTTNVVVQPVAGVGLTIEEYPAVVIELIEYMQARHPRVRVIPQMHKFVWGMNSKSV